MAYTNNQNAGGLDTLTSLDTGDLIIVGDVSDSNRAKAITKSNMIDTPLALKANLASPTFTGTPAAPTPTAGTDSTQIATTAYVQDLITIETTTGTTHSLTTVAGQKVIVWGKGSYTGSDVEQDIQLKYNGVVKDASTIDIGSGSEDYPFSLMYTETPGAATQNITMDCSGAGSVSDGVIIVMKIL